MKNRTIISVLPVMVAAAGTVFLLFGYWDYKKEAYDVERLFRAHVDSVALLVKEGAREAAASTSLIYDLTEQNLLTASRCLSASTKDALADKPHGGLAVSLVLSEGGTINGAWGPVPPASRQALIDWMRQGPPNALIDDGPVGDNGLACILHSHSPEGASLVCRDAEELEMLRREIGIGPLLKGVIQQDVRYVVLQDTEGILAVAPSPELVSSWEDDPFLGTALATAPPTGLSRLRYVKGRPVFEGLIPFRMADDSLVLLRVGIDAALLQNITKSAEQRFIAMVVLVAGMVLMSTLSTLIFLHWQRRKQEMDRLMKVEEESRKHWETIGQMAATVAHEVRNPLNTVGMISQRLKREFTIKEAERREFDEMIDILLSETERVGHVVTEFLDLGKPLALALQPVDPNDAVSEAVLTMRMRALKEEKQLTLENRCRGQISLDAGRFRQIMNNLIDNALDAVPKNGEVRVYAESRDDGLLVRISDNGPGLMPADCDEVLKPFVSFKANGTGLGLPIVKRIAEAHGGTLRITSSPGIGTTVEVIIPNTLSKSRG